MFRLLWSARLSSACTATLVLAGCATAGGPTHAQSAAESANEKPTVEQVFQWPLEGRAGLERTVKALGKLFPDARRLTSAAALDSDTDVVLRDGATISSATFSQEPPDINLTFSSIPCIDAKRIAELVDARLNDSRVIKEMPDLGARYEAERYDVSFAFVTEPVTHKCVRAMFVRASPKEASTD